VTTPFARANGAFVTSLRHHIHGHRRWAAALVALALLMKLLVPAGFMASASNGTIQIELCASSGPRTIVIAIPGLDHDKKSEAAKGDGPCTFSGHAAPSLGAADPILLAVAIAFIVATVFRTAPVGTPRRRAHLRPPLRGPPATV